jgi:hypothetical protein
VEAEEALELLERQELHQVLVGLEATDAPMKLPELFMAAAAEVVVILRAAMVGLEAVVKVGPVPPVLV